MNDKVLGILIISIILLSSINFISAEIGDSSIETFIVGPSKVDCVGIFPQKCLVVNGEYFYNTIDGFNYEDGYEYELLVNIIQIYDEINAPQDASIYKYELVQIISKQKVSSNNWVIGIVIIIILSTSFLIIRKKR